MVSELRQAVEKYLLAEAGVPPEKVEDVIEKSANKLRSIMSVLDDAVDNGDFEEIISSAQRLEGELQSLGLEELSVVANNIKTTAASNVPAYMACYCMRLLKELRPFLSK